MAFPISSAKVGQVIEKGKGTSLKLQMDCMSNTKQKKIKRK